jgi:alpha-L-fucosidase
MTKHNPLLPLLLFWLGLGVACTSGGRSGQAPETAETESAALEPNPVVPAPRQVAYQQQEMIAFAHFTVNTFTDKEWGDGTESPQIFNPSAFDARQWARTCKEAGLKTLILTAKHHDGFCLWPSQYTDHSVKSSPWKDGKGDMVKEVAEACRAEGIKFGVYLSPWDRHEPSYGTSTYNDYYKNQLRELLTNYGEISEVWLDGAKGENAKDMEYDFEGYWALVRELQPKAVLFSDAGPDVRWVGNEKGFAGETNWSMMDRSRVKIGTSETDYLNTGDPKGSDWVTAECDVSIRPGWFYHPAEDSKVKSLNQLLDIYYKSVGRNGVLLLNIPPDRRGLFHENDVQRLREFRAALDETFKTNLAAGKKATASSTHSSTHSPAKLTDGDATSYWAPARNETASVEIDLGGPQTFDRAMLAEPIEKGQRVAKFTLEAWVGNAWQPLAAGTTIGYKRLLRFEEVRAEKVRLTIQEANNTPLISEVGLFKASAKEVL